MDARLAGGNSDIGVALAYAASNMRPSAKNTFHREALISLLHQAAELEHGLACAYLFAAFSSKTELMKGSPTRRSIRCRVGGRRLLESLFRRWGISRS